MTTLVLIALVVHIKLSLIGWGNTLCDWYGFRQTQTAISTYYTIRDGFSVNYITPVLGKPWSIPMEFPLFQWIVAAAVIIFKAPLDQCGRFFNLLFFYLSLIPTYFILARFITKKVHVLVFFCLLLACPEYIFWSRTFLMESLAVFLSLTYLAGIVCLSKHRRLSLVLCCLTGTLAGLTKVTTFLIFIIPGFAFVLRSWIYNASSISDFFKTTRSKIITTSALFVIPLIINAFWIHYADQQKSLNPLANHFITYSALKNWNFGTLHQRVDYITWGKFLHFSRFFIYYKITGILIIGLLAILGLLFLVSGKYRKLALFFFICYLCGPLIFTNLYYVHEYYYYANGFFLLFALGFLVLGVIESGGGEIRVLSGFLILPLLMGLMYKTYYHHFYASQKTNHTQYVGLTNAIRSFTNEDDVILIYGFDWSSEIPYYSQRKAIMDRWDLSMNEDKFKCSTELLGNNRIGGMVIGGNNRDNQVFITERIQKFGFLPHPVFQDVIADFYIIQDNSRK